MNIQDLLNADDIDRLHKVSGVVDDLKPILQQVKDAGIPIDEHLQRLQGADDWLNKMYKAFNLTRPTKT